MAELQPEPVELEPAEVEASKVEASKVAFPREAHLPDRQSLWKLRVAFPLAPQLRVQPAPAMAAARAHRRPEACKAERWAEPVAVWDAVSLAGTAASVPLPQAAGPVGLGE